MTHHFFRAFILVSILPLPAVAAPSFSELKAGIVKINSSGCMDTKAANGKKGSGFAVSLGDTTMVVTCLHVVARCKSFSVTNHQNTRATAEIKSVLRAADLVLLTLKTGMDMKPLNFSSTHPKSGDPVTVVGFGRSRDAQSKDIKVRSFGPSSLDGIIEDLSTKRDLQAIGIDIAERIINLDGSIMPGDSGGPLFSNTGEVVGIAEGGLMAGALPVSWAIPSSRLSELFASTDQDINTAPSTAGTRSVLVTAEEHVSETADGLRFSYASTRTVQCGGAQFSHIATRTFTQISNSADVLSRSQIDWIVLMASNVGSQIAPSERFDVFSDLNTGATFSIPSSLDLKSGVGGGDCLAIGRDDKFEFRVTSRQALDPVQLSQEADLFFARSIRMGEFTMTNPMFTMPGIATRAHDNMMVRRVGQTIGAPTYPIPLEEFLSHTHRAGTYLGVSLRSLQPQQVQRVSDWLPALLAIYVSGFAF